MSTNNSDKRNASRLQYTMQYVFRTVLSLAAIVVLFVVIKKFIPASMADLFLPLTNNATLLFSVFFVSESFLGLLFPDLFIIWAVEEATPILYVFLLGGLSYFGGIISYWIGDLLGKYRFFERLVKYVRSKYAHRIQKWGVFFVVLAALTPIPFSPVSMLYGSMKLPFKDFAIYSLARIIRFAIYGYIFWHAKDI